MHLYNPLVESYLCELLERDNYFFWLRQETSLVLFWQYESGSSKIKEGGKISEREVAS